MAVQLEFINILIKRESIHRIISGGWEEFCVRWSQNSLQTSLPYLALINLPQRPLWRYR
jgi:hypothetical protein